MAELVRADADRVAAGLRAGDVVRVRLAPPLGAAAIVVLATLAANWLPVRTIAAPEPDEIVALTDAARRDAAEAIRAALEATSPDDLGEAGDDAFAPPDDGSPEAMLEALAEQLGGDRGTDGRDPDGIRAETATGLSDAARALERQARRDEAAIDALTERFAGVPEPRSDGPLPASLPEAVDAMRRGDWTRAAEALDELERWSRSATPEERARAAEALEEVAGAIEDAAASGSPAGDEARRSMLRDELIERGLDPALAGELLADPPSGDGAAETPTDDATEPDASDDPGDPEPPAAEESTDRPAPADDPSRTPPAGDPPAGSEPPNDSNPPADSAATDQSESGSPNETRPEDRPGDQPQDQPQSRPGDQPQSQPGDRPGQEPAPGGAESPSTEGAAPGTSPTEQPERAPGEQPGGSTSSPEPGQQPGRQPGTQPGEGPPDAETIERRLREQGVDPSSAERAAEAIERMREDRAAEESAGRDARAISEDLRETAERLRSDPPTSEPPAAESPGQGEPESEQPGAQPSEPPTQRPDAQPGEAPTQQPGGQPGEAPSGPSSDQPGEPSGTSAATSPPAAGEPGGVDSIRELARRQQSIDQRRRAADTARREADRLAGGDAADRSTESGRGPGGTERPTEMRDPTGDRAMAERLEELDAGGDPVGGPADAFFEGDLDDLEPDEIARSTGRRLTEAREVAERAVNESAIPRRYHPYVKRLFDRLSELDGDAPAGPPASPSRSDAEP